MEQITFLELNRHEGESIIIGDDIIITVTRIRKTREVVHLGIVAPGLNVARSEVLVTDPKEHTPGQ